MAYRHFDILFDNPSSTYNSGSNITGKVQLTLDKPKNITGIKIEFLGIANTSWLVPQTEERSNNRRTVHMKPVGAQERLLSNKYFLTGGSKNEFNIGSGGHVYPFSTALPPQLPSSFESEHGHIRYSVTATLVLPKRFNKHVQKVFYVFSPVDLTLNPKAKEPARLELEKRFWCCWCRSGPLKMVINLPYSGYIPGQAIPLTLEVDNASNVRVERVVVELVKEMIWRGIVPLIEEKEFSETILEVTLGQVGAKESTQFAHRLTVPTISTPNLDLCSIIDCNYILQVTAEVGGCHIDFVGKVPIFLGTVPLHQSINSPFTQKNSSPNFIPPQGASSGTSYLAWPEPMNPPSATNTTFSSRLQRR